MSSLERLYRKLVVDSDPSPRNGAALHEDEPRNFFLFVGSHFLTKLGDALSNPKTTLTWLAGSLGVASWMTALLVPLRESGSMLVQIGLAGIVERFRHRKWVWTLGALLQAGCMFGMALCALLLRGYVAGLVLLGLLALFALSRSLSSVASKDVLGRTLPKRRRGRANGWAASTAGVATLGIGATAAWLGPGQFPAPDYAFVLAGAGLMWVVGALLFAGLREPAAENGGTDTDTRLRMLFRDRRLQRFVIARALLMCTALSAPYYVMLAHRHGGETLRLLAVFVTVDGIASMLGGPVWGRLADRSSRHVMLIGGLAASVLGAVLAVLAFGYSALLSPAWFMPLMYFLLSLAHQAVRTGRKTYVIDMAEGDTRTDYVAVSNSAIGVLLLIVGGGIAALSSWSLSAALAVLAAMGGCGALLCAQLPSVTDGED
ncbi:MFS transporter [Oleiagrimonas citrea]|uniref:MFS transporter n=1 Tax=Oleiagrimonas citrea TaxID=1665687 RepID=A0A846ZNP7_9GAMM|nr:MFS transporter [Oleiagrimonas citrea]NKZ39287.1 MFS transporter [Oleiagrimonas citrea]